MHKIGIGLLFMLLVLVSANCSGNSFDIANLPIIGRTNTPSPTATLLPSPTYKPSLTLTSASTLPPTATVTVTPKPSTTLNAAEIAKELPWVMDPKPAPGVMTYFSIGGAGQKEQSHFSLH